jgi:hypothetical protein
MAKHPAILPLESRALFLEGFRTRLRLRGPPVTSETATQISRLGNRWSRFTVSENPPARIGALTSHRPAEPHRLLSGVLTAPKSKIQFNGVGGLRTHISLRASQSVFHEEQGDDRGSHGTMCLFQHQHFPGSRSRRGSLALRGFSFRTPATRCNLPRPPDLTPSKHNAARAEYDRSAALRLYSWALKSPSRDQSARAVPRFM